MFNRLRVHFFATAALAIASLLLPTATHVEVPQAKTFANIAKSIAAEYDANPSKALDTVLLVDPSARQSAAFKAIEPKLTALGGSMFKGALNSSEVHSLDGLEGITLDLNRPVSAIPVAEAKPQSQIPKLLWDAAVTVPETDAGLAAARAENNVDGTGVLVAVLDTGIDPEALGLGNGKVVYRQDFTTPRADGSCTDDGRLDPYGHGTHVSSILAGAPDSRDPSVVGIAPGANLIDLRVLDCSGSGEFSGIDQALQWILDHRVEYPVDVVNMSIGASDGQKDGLDPTGILINRLVAQGVFVAVAAGNGYASASNLFSPATAEFGTTVAAATVNKYGKFLSQFSSHGPTSDGRPGIDFTAPGSGIRAALTTAKSSLNNYSVVMSGTSMASPYLAGIATLLLQQNPTAAPSGTLCEVSADCPAGVVKASMTNGVEQLMEASDWFEPGVDAHSGAGVVSASASLEGSTMAASFNTRGRLDTASNNLIQVPAHEGSHTLSLLLDSSYRDSIWVLSTFSVIQVGSGYTQQPITAVCTLLAETSCLFGESGFTPRLFTYYLAPSTETTTLVIKSSKAVDYTINIDSYQGSLNLSSGVKASPIDLDGATSGSITLERTLPSDTPTSYQVTATGGLGVGSSVTLPAGPAGTSVAFLVAKSTTTKTSTDRVVFTDPSGAMVATSVRNTVTGDGPLIFPNAGGYDDSDQWSNTYIADDGSILGNSVSTGVANSSGYANPYRVAANSRVVTQYGISQTTASQIDAVAFSRDGSTGFFRQYPAGAGVVPGDGSMDWTYFARNLDTGVSYEVGPDWSQWSAWNSAPSPVLIPNEDGSAVAWTVKYPSGEHPQVLVTQSGAGFGTDTLLDSFSASTTISIFGYTNGKVLVRVSEDAVVDELRLYTAADTYTVIEQSGIQPMLATFSENGSAVGFVNWNSDVLRCNVNGVTSNFTPPAQLGTSYPTFVRVANDCSWMVVPWDISPGFPRGQHGVQLIRIKADGTITRLDQTPDTSVTWISNLAATKFLRSTATALEPGDLNGMPELYRGLASQTETSVFLKQLPQLNWNISQEPLAFGQRLTLSALSSDSNAAITYTLTQGQCSLNGDVIEALSGLGSCTVEARIAENDQWLSTKVTTSIALTKAARPSGEVTFTAPQSVEVGSTINFVFNNPNQLPYQLFAHDACALVDGVFKALFVGTCVIEMVRHEETNYRENNLFAIIQISKLQWTSSQLAIGDVGVKYAGDSFELPLVNTTGQTPSYFAFGGCSYNGIQVTIGAVGTTCSITAVIDETPDRATTSVTRAFTIGTRTTVTSAILDTDWVTGKVLPRGSKLSVNAAATVIAGPCTYSALKIMSNATSGTCTFTVGGYNEGSIAYTAKTYTIKLGPSVQTWTIALPTYSSKKLTGSKLVIALKGYATTNLGLKGTWNATSGCKVTVTSKGVTLDMGKLKKCVVTLKAAAGFRVPALTKTYTFTR